MDEGVLCEAKPIAVSASELWDVEVGACSVVSVYYFDGQVVRERESVCV